MNDEQGIYCHQAEQYETLISREDYQGNLQKTITAILPLAGLSVLELGAGTRRLTRLLAPYAHYIIGLDLSLPALDIARQKLSQAGFDHFAMAAADHCHLPVKDDTANLIIAGWSLCYLVSPGTDELCPDWQHSLITVFKEIMRTLCPGGTIILIETLGTGFERPHPPEQLKNYFQWLNINGFSSTWTRTDYRFASLSEAEELTRFFFGERTAQQVVTNEWTILPECTGIWWKKDIEL